MLKRKKRNYLPLDLQFFAEGGEGQGSQGTEGQQGTDLQQQGTDGAGTTQGSEQGGEGQEKTFTQTELNSFLANQKKDTQTKILKQLGVENLDSAKEALTKFNEWKESQKTEAEKQTEQLTAVQQEAQQAKEEAAALKAQIAAFKANVNPDYLDDVLLLAKSKDAETIEDAIASVLDRHPHFKAVQQEDQGGQTPPKFTQGQHKKDSGDTDTFVSALFGKK
jgi:hypothetical protein